jgi:O-acetyl-ADP-ribose deacetylase (regulator of RNase III)
MKKINLKVSDITKEKVCAIVNAANSSLMGGGGVDGAIHNAGGKAVINECRNIRNTTHPDGLPTGEAVHTSAGNMPATYVIHTVGPVYNNCVDESEQLLANCYTNSLRLAFDLGCDSIAFPAISTGIYGYPKEKAAIIAYEAVRKFLNQNNMEVNFIFSTQQNKKIFEQSIKNL